MSGKKSKRPASHSGSSLTDAVVAALAEVDDQTEAGGEPAPAAEAGCAQTDQQAKGAAKQPPLVSEPPLASGAPEPATASPINGADGFRSGPGSFADLTRRWAGLPAATPAHGSNGGPSADASPPTPDEAGSEAAGSQAAGSQAAEPPLVSEPPLPAEPAVVVASDADGDGEPAEPAAEEPDAAGADAPAADDPTATLEDATLEVSSSAEPGPIEVVYYGRTDVGLVREHNEDNFTVADLDAEVRDNETPRETVVGERGLIFAVCDGMGGAAAGEVASQMAVDTVHEVMSSATPGDRDDFARRLVRAIEEAGYRIFSAAKMDRTRRGMGTTATVAGLVDNVLFVGQVGDSRAYILRGDQFEMITKDQSLVNQLIEAGQLTEEEAEAFEHSNIILQALGTTEEVTVDLTFLEVRKGDRLMMCSDGLCGLVHADMMKEVLQGTRPQEEASQKLIQMANAGGGHDNITVIIADFDGDGLSEAESAKVLYQQYPLPPDESGRDPSMPPRETSMKAGATKPGADVKRNGDPNDVEVASPSSGGSKAWVLLLLVIVLLALIAGAWLAMRGLGTDGAADGDATPPEPIVEEPIGQEEVPVPLEDETLDEPTTEALPSETADQGSIAISTDLSAGTLYVNGQLHGPLEDGMELELPPGAYELEARDGEAQVARQTVTLEAGSAVDVDLSVPAGQLEVEGPADPPPETRRPEPNTQRPQRGSGRSGGRSGQRDGPLPSNPF